MYLNIIILCAFIDSVAKANGLSKSTRKRPFQSDCQTGACKSEYIYGKLPGTVTINKLSLVNDEEDFTNSETTRTYSDNNRKLNCHSIVSATRKQLNSSADGSQQSGEAKRKQYCRRKCIQSSKAAKIDGSDSENSSYSEGAERKKLHIKKAHRHKPRTAYDKSINPILKKSLKSQLPKDRIPDKHPVFTHNTIVTSEFEGDSELDQYSDNIKEEHMCRKTVDSSGKSKSESEIQHKGNGTDSLPNSKESSKNTRSKTRVDSSCPDLEIKSYTNYSDVKTQPKKKKEKTDDIKEGNFYKTDIFSLIILKVMFVVLCANYNVYYILYEINIFLTLRIALKGCIIYLFFENAILSTN